MLIISSMASSIHAAQMADGTSSWLDGRGSTHAAPSCTSVNTAQ